MKFYGIKDDDAEGFCDFLEEYKNLRGEYGLR
jgi:hypothetical protein